MKNTMSSVVLTIAGLVAALYLVSAMGVWDSCDVGCWVRYAEFWRD